MMRCRLAQQQLTHRQRHNLQRGWRCQTLTSRFLSRPAASFRQPLFMISSFSNHSCRLVPSLCSGPSRCFCAWPGNARKRRNLTRPVCRSFCSSFLYLVSQQPSYPRLHVSVLTESCSFWRNSPRDATVRPLVSFICHGHGLQPSSTLLVRFKMPSVVAAHL